MSGALILPRPLSERLYRPGFNLRRLSRIFSEIYVPGSNTQLEVRKKNLYADAVTDPLFANVRYLIPMSTNFADVKGHATIVNGNLVVNATNPPFVGVSSAAADGTGDYFTSPSSTDLDLGANANYSWTMEWLARYTSGKAGGVDAMCFRNSAVGYGWGGNYIEATQSFNFTLTDSGVVFQNLVGTAGQVPVNTWVHHAITRHKPTNTYALWCGGLLSASAVNGTNPNTAGNQSLWMGRDFTATARDLLGRMAQFRLTVGVGGENARYTAPFTPPSAPFPTS